MSKAPIDGDYEHSFSEDNNSSRRLFIAFFITTTIFGGIAYFGQRLLPPADKQGAPAKKETATQVAPGPRKKTEFRKRDQIKLEMLALSSSSARSASSPTNLDRSVTHSNIPYCLPFSRGYSPLVSQTTEGKTHSGANRYAIDFQVPVGTPIHAARAGRVVQVIQRFDEHAMTEEMPHLHFEVDRKVGDKTESIPVSFILANEEIVTLATGKRYNPAPICNP